ncbi:MAG: hypothetical protein FJ026_06555 [Chloroflexi bacterium]|nr:hypothetical protein [Chloroflexota bacterium]
MEATVDDTYAQMTTFLQTLKDFNTHLHVSVSDLAHHHEAVNPLWQDSFRRQYDAEWQQFVDLMARYLNQEAPAYEQYLYEKLIALGGYLYGN